MPATKPTSVARYESMLPARAAPPTVPPVVDSRCSRILAYGDSLTAGYYDRGAAFWPYANSLRSALCACAVATSSGGRADSSVRAERSAVTIDVCGASGLAALQLVQTLDSKTLYDVCDREYSGLRYLLNKTKRQHQAASENGVLYDAALIMLGTNDLAQEGVTAQEIVAAITQLHMVCHSYGLRTVALPIPPSRASSTPREDLVMYQNTRQQVNRLLKDWTDTQAGKSLFVDVTSSLPPWSEGGECWENDGLHLSPAGSQRLGELLGAHEPLARFLLRDAHAAIQLERELEPEPWQPQTTRSSGHVALRPRDEVFAADARQVAYQAGVTEAVARDALARNGYEMVVAVLDLASGNGRAPL